MEIIFCVQENSGLPSSSSTASLKAFWQRLWKLKVQGKVKHFLWPACPNLLPTKQNLKKKKILIGNYSDFCVGNQENLLHCLWDCEALRAVWDVDFSWIDWRKISRGSPIDLVEVISNKPNALENFAVTAWMLWRQQNRFVSMKKPHRWTACIPRVAITSVNTTSSSPSMCVKTKKMCQVETSGCGLPQNKLWWGCFYKNWRSTYWCGH